MLWQKNIRSHAPDIFLPQSGILSCQPFNFLKIFFKVSNKKSGISTHNSSVLSSGTSKVMIAETPIQLSAPNVVPLAFTQSPSTNISIPCYQNRNWYPNFSDALYTDDFVKPLFLFRWAGMAFKSAK